MELKLQFKLNQSFLGWKSDVNLGIPEIVVISVEVLCVHAGRSPFSLMSHLTVLSVEISQQGLERRRR